MRVDVGVDDAGDERRQGRARFVLRERGLGDGTELLEAVGAQRLEHHVLARVPAVQRTDADPRNLGDGRDRRVRVVEEHEAGGLEDGPIVAGRLCAPTAEWFGRLGHLPRLALDRNDPFRYGGR